jgi:hypothetical protein
MFRVCAYATISLIVNKMCSRWSFSQNGMCFNDLGHVFLPQCPFTSVILIVILQIYGGR